MLYTTPQENAKHLMGTTQTTVSTQPRPEQEPGNLERKTETDTGAGQKKQLPTLGITDVYKCVTQYLHTSNKLYSRGYKKANFALFIFK